MGNREAKGFVCTTYGCEIRGGMLGGGVVYGGGVKGRKNMGQL